MSQNELITAVNILSNNVTLTESNNSICIDTQKNNLGILTDEPKYQLDICSIGLDTSVVSAGINTPRIIFNSKNMGGNIATLSGPLTISADTIIDGTLTISADTIIDGTLRLNENSTFTFITCLNDLSVNGEISCNSMIISNDLSVNGDISCNKLFVNQEISGDISFNGNSTFNGDISFIGNFDFSGGDVTFDASLVVGSLDAGSFNGSVLNIRSDDRLKHNEKNITNGLEIIRQLEPQIYQKTRNFKVLDFSGTVNEAFIVEAGFIAQEVEKINDLSFSVNIGNEVKPYSLNYNNIFVYGVAALQELDKKIINKEIDDQEIYNNLLNANNINNINNINDLVKNQNLIIQTLNNKIKNLENRIINLEK